MGEWAVIPASLLIMWIGMGGFSVMVLWRLYIVDRRYRRRYNMPAGFMTLTLALGATVTFAAAAWAAFLTVRRLLDMPVLEWTPWVTVPLLLLALSVPIGFAAVVLYQRYRS